MPFTRAFVLANGRYRDCCVTYPQRVSSHEESFTTWWTGDQMTAVRNSLLSSSLPSACKNCEIKEQIHGTSFRLAANKEINYLEEQSTSPDTWHIMFGNKCNLACWSCSEKSSSLIAAHKNQINILPENFIDPNKEFDSKWPDLKRNIIDSYNHHDSIRICLLGGEPIYNKNVIEFLEYLIEQGLSSKTKLEFTTNGTIFGERLIKLFKRSQWEYICIFVSVDAIGRSSEWIRYGSNWSVIETNIMKYRDMVNYIEIQTTLSILNLLALPDVVDFCKEHNLPHSVVMLSNPEFMNLQKWDGNTSMLNRQPFIDRKLDSYIDLLGSNVTIGTSSKLHAYIQQFSTIRKPLVDFDPVLARFLGLI